MNNRIEIGCKTTKLKKNLKPTRHTSMADDGKQNLPWIVHGIVDYPWMELLEHYCGGNYTL